MVNPVPGYQNPSVDRAGRSSTEEFRFKKSITDWINKFDPTGVVKLIVGSPTDGDLGDGSVNAEALYENGKRAFIQGGQADEGLGHNPVDHGTVSSGTLTIDPLAGFFQKVTVTGSVVIAPASGRTGSCVLHIQNGASANASFGGWSKKYPGSTVSTVNGNKFATFMYFFGSDGADYAVQARQ